MDFWGHLEVMRGAILRSLSVVMVLGIVAFILKDQLFWLIFWPESASFPTWAALTHWHLMPPIEPIHLINTELASQFIVHLETAMCVGLILASPYLEYELVRFVRPALYPKEQKVVLPLMIMAYVLFIMGVMLSYFVIFPFTFRFLGTYQVTDQVVNYINLQSYTSTLLIMSLIMGLVFELPIVCYILGRMGILTRDIMRHYRRHAIVAIFILAAVITPTGDAFTLCLVALPIWFLYEVGVWLVRK